MRIIRLVFLFALNRSIFGIQVTFKNDKLRVKFYSFMDECRTVKSSKLSFKTALSKHDPHFVRVETNVTEDIKKATFEIQFERCVSVENPDTCAKIMRFTTKHFCRFVDDRRQFWSPLVACLKPNVTCPIKKGIYAGDLCGFDMMQFRFFPANKELWKAKCLLYFNDAKTPSACFYFEAQML